jgi:DNA-binding transcriptional LysR family regulator
VGPKLSSEPRILAVARDHPLADRNQVSIEDVADFEVAPLPGLPSETVERLIPLTTPNDRTIQRRQMKRAPRTPHELVTLIVHPTVPSFGTYFGHPDIVLVPIADMPPSSSGLVWRRRAYDPRLREFIRVARDVLHSASD